MLFFYSFLYYSLFLLSMSEEECKCYRFGYSGYNFLSVNRSVYTQSELLPDSIIREVICDKEDKWMKVRERKDENEEWNEIDLDGLQRGITLDLSEKGDRWEGDSLKGSLFACTCMYLHVLAWRCCEV